MVLLKSEQRLKIGDKAPEFELMGADGKKHKLDDYSEGRAIVIVFMCNHCPYVLAKLETLKKIYENYSKKGAVFVGINSNNNPAYPEDSYENMKKLVHDKGIKFDYLFDETQDVAKRYGAVCTPDPFLFDGEMRLVYHGRIDNAKMQDEPEGANDSAAAGNDEVEGASTSNDLANALEDVLTGRLPPSEFKPSLGCSIKWDK